MAIITITIDTANSAFDPMYGGHGAELSSLLHGLADKAYGVDETDLDGLKILDSNGNAVGKVETTKDETYEGHIGSGLG